MKRARRTGKCRQIVIGTLLLAILALVPVSLRAADDLAAELRQTGFKIVYETYQGNNWELAIVGMDGGLPVNLTRTPNIDEHYPKVSPDGKKIAFLVDEGQGESTVRSLWVMNRDGSGRQSIASDARWPCWSPDGKAIAYVRQEAKPFAYNDPYTRGVVVYYLVSGRQTEHPNKNLEHIYNLCWSPDRRWFLATVSGGMGYRHTNLAIQADGLRVIDLGLPGCRPDISPDGRKVAWGASDWTMRVGDLELTGLEPKVTNMRDVVNSTKPVAVYHMDWSPDGKYVAFSRGPATKRLGPHAAIVGARADGWDICVADASGKDRWVAITSDGNSNKEPDWLPLPPCEP